MMYIICIRYVRTVEIVTHLAKALVEHVTILEKSDYYQWYEIERNTVDLEFCYVFASFNHAGKQGKTRCTIADLTRVFAFGVLPRESASNRRPAP